MPEAIATLDEMPPPAVEAEFSAWLNWYVGEYEANVDLFMRHAAPEPDEPHRYAIKRPLYVRRDVLNASAIIDWAKANGFATTLVPQDMHVTCAYSKTPIDWEAIDPAWESVIVGESRGRAVEQLGDKGAVVLKFASLDLQDRFTAFQNAGASWDYEQYVPHITITYQPPAGLDPAKVPPYEGPIVLGPEIFEDIDENAAEDIEEYDFDPAKHPRHEAGDSRGGEFAPKGGSELRLLDAIQNAGGFTYQPITEEMPQPGDHAYAVSPYKDREQVLDMSTLRPADLARYASANADLLSREDHYFGAWKNPADGKVYLDVAVVARSVTAATDLCKRYKQIAYFDFTKMDAVVVNPQLREHAHGQASPRYRAAGSDHSAHRLDVQGPDGAGSDPGGDRRIAARTRHDYAKLEGELNDLEGQALRALGPAIVDSRDRFLGYIKKSLTFAMSDRSTWLERLDLKGWGPVQDAFGEMLRQGWEHGRRYVRTVTPAVRPLAAASFAPRASLEWLKRHQLYVSGVARDDLLKRAKGLILQALKTGEAEDATMEKLRNAWAPYVGDAVDPSAMARLRTIIRTNMTEALNLGIVTEARAMNASRDPAERKVIKALAYVAVLDDRTTEICTLLHGTQIWPDDPRLDAIVPPNHFNCRSVLDPVILDEEYDPDALLSVSKYKQAVALIQPGFGGDKAVNLSQQEVAQ